MPYSTKRIIVKFRSAPGGSLTELCDKVAEMTHGVLARKPSATGRAVFEVDPASDLDDLIREISGLPAVEYAEPEVVDRIS
jgi:hypothetical protein